eukprot:13841094-Ditylum_brightwellii.AAC.1
MLKSEFAKFATGHHNISNCTFNMDTMTIETKQVEVGKSSTKLPAANVPVHKEPKNPYVASRPNTIYSPAEYFPMLETPTNSLGT